ncbi:hypothetical protein RRG08_001218 [Elysia crispata]|uniref:Uncharacterized protein n=1 Tax=Elysia crispata TaxID=231223 RepID=A0AAE1EBV7_9GAST|nr:hypothetical protein RRG08_001218 [Elysia crispata]
MDSPHQTSHHLPILPVYYQTVQHLCQAKDCHLFPKVGQTAQLCDHRNFGPTCRQALLINVKCFITSYLKTSHLSVRIDADTDD